jgi:hypothetical protein
MDFKHLERSPADRSLMAGISHLAGPAAPVRQLLAAYFVRECPHIVEIGGHLTPVTPFLIHHPESVLVVDPKIVPRDEAQLNGRPCRVRHVASKFQALTFDLAPHTYGLVMLGYSLKRAGGSEALGGKLLDLVDQARIVVIEWALELERAALQVPHLLSRPGLRQLCRIDFTLEDGTIEHSPYGQRRLVVLESAGRGGQR